MFDLDAITATSLIADEATRLVSALWEEHQADALLRDFDLASAEERVSDCAERAHRVWRGAGLYTVDFAEPTPDAILSLVYEAESVVQLAAYLATWDTPISSVMRGERPVWL